MGWFSNKSTSPEEREIQEQKRLEREKAWNLQYEGLRTHMRQCLQDAREQAREKYPNVSDRYINAQVRFESCSEDDDGFPMIPICEDSKNNYVANGEENAPRGSSSYHQDYPLVKFRGFMGCENGIIVNDLWLTIINSRNEISMLRTRLEHLEKAQQATAPQAPPTAGNQHIAPT